MYILIELFLYWIGQIVPKLYYVPEPSSSVGGSMSSVSDVATMHPAKEKNQPFLWSQALYLIARLLSMLYLGCLNIKDGAYIRGCLILLNTHELNYYTLNVYGCTQICINFYT